MAVMPYSSSAGSSGIAHLACAYGVPIVASDIPDFHQLADEEGLAIDFVPPSDSEAIAQHIVGLLKVQNVRWRWHYRMSRLPYE